MIGGSNVVRMQTIGLFTSNFSASNAVVNVIKNSNIYTSNITLGNVGKWNETILQASNVEFSNCLINNNLETKRLFTTEVSAKTLYFLDSNGIVMKEINGDTILSGGGGGGGSIDLFDIVANSVTTSNIRAGGVNANGVLCSGLVIQKGDIGELTFSGTGNIGNGGGGGGYTEKTNIIGSNIVGSNIVSYNDVYCSGLVLDSDGDYSMFIGGVNDTVFNGSGSWGGYTEKTNIIGSNIVGSNLVSYNNVYCSGIVVGNGGDYSMYLGGQSTNNNTISGVDLTKIVIGNETIGSWTSNGLHIANGLHIGVGDPSYDFPVRIEEMNSNNYSLYSAGSLLARGYQYFSDLRIKKEIVEIDQLKALASVNALKPCEYSYKDLDMGCKKAGFIAQDVEKCIPTAVSTCSEYIPDLMESVVITNIAEDVITIESTNDINTINNPIDVKLVFRKTYYYGSLCIDRGVTSVTCKKLAHDVEIGCQMVLIGTKVDDFKVIEYEQIVAHLVSAVQALSLQLSSR
jgi:hypothetical protein